MMLLPIQRVEIFSQVSGIPDVQGQLEAVQNLNDAAGAVLRHRLIV